MITLPVALIILASDAARMSSDIKLAHEAPSLEEKFACKPGQGAAFGTYHETGDNSFKSCAALCDADAECTGFDFTAKNSSHPEIFSFKPTLHKRDSCRLFNVNIAVRWEDDAAKKEALELSGVSSGPGSGRQFCSKLKLPSLHEKFACLPGQGPAAESYVETEDKTFEGCAEKCDDDDHCVAFDFTTANSSHPELFSLHPTLFKKDSCRLYPWPPLPTEIRLSNTSARSYCEKIKYLTNTTSSTTSKPE
mmetsp:Transcript_60856/g.108068  ORF Transcript_60856/g.108068 Transcript_60856/m.108068 type:complete len:250 (-) Transcript_60856:92-841(-)|eukprot:CAMPEP_0197630336 /NCGR_PEP_ID=MMETSP1338-20131121/7859_1 /TAXON_ID=43686 ORGANISM="Pelagodinium beii, Strain RCC1491" /NCGR_SAMPLE_ID=MMETSP1338 /ASSEMBLY_ACC=CAM_ASM_000754 /LENGTH=249 /DNA_ID=CAMNT_0043201537 /DNA_START=97 /DNA_END=846 /DNA_ORIENTATION=-